MLCGGLVKFTALPCITIEIKTTKQQHIVKPVVMVFHYSTKE